MNTIKVAICDDYKYLLESYTDILQLEDNIEVIWTAQNGEQCMEKIKDNPPDILLLDIQMSSESEGIELLKTIKPQYPNVKIIMLTGYSYDDYIFNAFTSGASNYILKDDTDENIIATINDVYNNKIIIKDEISKKFIMQSSVLQEANKSLLYFFNKISNLTRTELEVLIELSHGHSYKDIAAMRYIEEGTARKIGSNILHKFNAESTKQLIELLNKHKIFELIERERE